MEDKIKDKINGFFKKLCYFLKNNNSELMNKKNSRDGRVDSSIYEDEIIKKIQQFAGFKNCNNKFIKAKSARNWYDFALKIDGTFVPVNIKITSGKTYDNVNSKEGLFWIFSDITGSNNRKWTKYKQIFATQILNKNIISNRDYYFLVFNKNQKKEIFFTSFKQLKEVKKNRNNLPFQAKWSDNKERVNRNDNAAYQYLFAVFNDSLLELKDISNLLDGFDK